MKNYYNLSNGLIIFIACTFLHLSCSSKNESVSKKEPLVNVLSELMTIEQLSISDSLKALKIKKLLAKKHVQIDSLKSAILLSDDKPEYWKSIFNRIKVKLKENEQRRLNKNVNESNPR
jgi:hypothetical protein